MRTRRHGGLSRLFFLLLAGAVLAGFWYFENYTIVTETIELTSDRLPAEFDGFRVAELADLHGRSFGGGNERLLDAVREAAPDLIAIDGDLADDQTDLKTIQILAEGLTKVAPVCYVTGNHEWAMDRRAELFSILEDAGVTLLHNEYFTLTRDGAVLVVAGVDDPNGPWDQKTPEILTEEIRAECGEAYILLLAHRNDQLSRWAALKLDTVLTGHAHGGVVRLPFLGGILGVDRQLLPEYSAGVYRRERTDMVVSRGLGGGTVPLRLFNRPHLPVLVLRAGQSVNNP